MKINLRSKKGILLTLTMIVLFVLMLGELITYIVLGISYDQLGANGSAAFSSSSLINLIDSGSSSFLSSSLNNALGALATYEGTPTLRYYTFVNNTQYALQSLMTNGTLYGLNMSGYMGGATLNQYAKSVKGSTLAQQGQLSLSNLSISVYQTSPFVITAKLTGLATLNSSYGYISYSISSTANSSINGTQDIYGLESDNPSVIKGMSSYPYPILITNSLAMAGSRSPYMFVYGTLVYIGGMPSCSNVPSQFWSSSYILVTPNAQSISSTVCGMGGLVTNALPSGGVITPYLVYTANQVSQSAIQNGTSALLNGASLSLLDLTPLQAAIQEGYYFASNYTPNYLQNVEQSTTKGSPGGIFSFNLLNRLEASFNGQNAYANVPSTNRLDPSGAFTLTAWVYVNSYNTSGGIECIACKWGQTSTKDQYLLGIQGSGNFVVALGNGVAEANAVAPQKISTGSWYQLGLIYTGNVEDAIINGQAVQLASGLHGSTVPTTLVPLAIGGELGSGTPNRLFNGIIANLQLYSSALSPAQVSSLYTSGLQGPPLFNSTLSAWYPLNGNINDYSGYNSNGTPTNVVYRGLQGYIADPIFYNLLNSYNSTTAKGVLNCANLNQCGNSSYSHLYLGPRALAVSNGVVLNESGALGLYNGVVPGGLSISTNTVAYVQTANAFSASAFSIGFWAYETSCSTPVHSGSMSFGCASSSEISLNCGSGAHTSSTGVISLNTWQYLSFSCGSSGAAYLDGQLEISGSYSIQAGNVLVFGSSSAGQFSGVISDVQVYNSLLTGAQIMQLYQNNTVNGILPTGSWPLSSPYNGLFNQTPDTARGNTGLFYHTSNVVCTSANVVYNTCGIQYVPT